RDGHVTGVPDVCSSDLAPQRTVLDHGAQVTRQKRLGGIEHERGGLADRNSAPGSRRGRPWIGLGETDTGARQTQKPYELRILCRSEERRVGKDRKFSGS